MFTFGISGVGWIGYGSCLLSDIVVLLYDFVNVDKWFKTSCLQTDLTSRDFTFFLGSENQLEQNNESFAVKSCQESFSFQSDNLILIWFFVLCFHNFSRQIIKVLLDFVFVWHFQKILQHSGQLHTVERPWVTSLTITKWERMMGRQRGFVNPFLNHEFLAAQILN